MKILHFVGIGKLPKDPDREAVGGATRAALEIARSQVVHGHQTVVAAVARRRWRAEWQGVQLASLPVMSHAHLRLGQRKLDLSVLLPLLIFSMRHRFDVVHSHEYNYLRYLPARIRVTQFHNDPCRYPSSDEAGAWEESECLAAARYSHAHVAVSRFVAMQLRTRYDGIAAALPAGFNPAGRIYVTYNGVDSDRFNPDTWLCERSEIRRSWGAAKEDVVFLYSGAIAPEKGVLQLIRAFIALSETNPRVKLVLAGHATLWEDADSRAGINEDHARFQRAVHEELADLAGQGRVVHLGLVSPDALPSVYAAADVVVAPSIVQEAFGLSAAEGLAMGKPLVASAGGGLTEFASEENSVLVPPGDQEALYRALRLLSEDDELRLRLGRAARRSVRSFTWARTARQLEDLYKDLLRRKPSIVCARPPALYRF